MKELSIEEKAKRYDGAKINGSRLWECGEITMANYEYMFPELKESEDERIRKAIIEFFKLQDDNTTYSLVPKNDILTWLEKQGNKPTKSIIELWKDMSLEVYQQASGNRHEPNCSDDTTKMFSLNDIDEIIEKLSEQNPVFEIKTPEESLGIDSDTYNEIVDECIYGEQKPFNYENATIQQTDFAPKVEPKFHEGEWITDGYLHYKITDVLEDRYIVDTKFVKRSAILFEREHNYHLWTIQDAKPGDVLYHSDSTSNGIFIFKEIIDKKFAKEVICYCCDYDSEDHLCLGEHQTCCLTDAKILYPATKVLRDLLFSKMKEAGYEWDAEKKELKKIEQKPQRIISAEAKEAMYDKPTWSEEDKELMKWSIDNLTELKDRFGEEYGNVGKCIDWLKSLRPQHRWKPSDEQLEALRIAAEVGTANNSWAMDILKCIYQYLKKLREE